MGKPFKKEIEIIPATINWAFQQPIKNLFEFIHNNSNTPLFIVGSGGSLSACYFAANLYQKAGTIAKAITPLELYYSKEALRNSKILFISSSGKNTDILFSFDIAIKQEPKSILTLCMKPNTPLSKAADKYSISKSLEFDIPSRRDGFLATNSLAAYYAILCKAFAYPPLLARESIIRKEFLYQVNEFVSKLSTSHSLTILYGGWGQSIAYDIESKFTEAALGNVLLSDYRNFGHGRHHWFAKREKNSAVIALITPQEKQIAEKTLAIIPNSIPRLIIESKNDSASCSIELLVKSFYLSNAFGEMLNIDPGRPGVPEFGSKLYHLKYSTFYKTSEAKQNHIEELHIIRKTGVPFYNKLSKEERSFWIEKYHEFLIKIRRTLFGVIIFDYDGTLCPPENRFIGLPNIIMEELIRLLNQGIIIGIATGRGKSVRDDFNKWVPNIFKKNIIIGYYNGSIVGSLSDNDIPDKNLKSHQLLELFDKKIKELKSSFPSIESELRPNQLTIEFKSTNDKERLLEIIRSIIFKPVFSNLEMLYSSHSVDIIKKPEVSKLNIIQECIKRARENKKSENFLCIGDKGKWPGNDFELLGCPISLSVEDVSSDPDTCWNLASLGKKNAEATLEYLKRLSIKNGNVMFN